MTLLSLPPEPPAPGLQRAGARLPIEEYSRRLWERRFFVITYARSSNAVGYEGNFLGQAWQLLTPLLNIAVYYVIFGLLLNTSRGVPNYISFLTVGVFIFGFCQQVLKSGSQSITKNIGLVRALQFPRAVLPISTTLVALLQLLYSIAVMVPILLMSGEPLTWRWVLLLPAVALLAIFGLGLSFVVARIGARVPDTAEVIPFLSRVWMYGSGVMYSVQVFSQGHAAWVATVLNLNPATVYLTLARSALLVGQPASMTTWALGVVWAVGVAAPAYLYFWRGEEEYGNV